MSLLRTLGFVLIAGSCLGITVPAQALDSTSRLEVYGGLFFFDNQSDSESREEIFGVRGSYSFSPRWSVEASAGRMDLSDRVSEPGELSLDVNLWVTDLSAKLAIPLGERSSVQIVAGPSYLFGTGDVDDFDSWGAHLGLGLEVGLGERFYLRPDVRAYRFDVDGEELDNTQATLALGVRF